VKVAVVRFPGANCDADCLWAFGTTLGHDAEYVWHKETRFAQPYDLVVLPGGFTYGDYLRPGAIARFSPIMPAVVEHARAGGLTIGICNGFQILTEAGLLPGALARNRQLEFISRQVHVRVERARPPWTGGLDEGAVLEMPIAHQDGAYTAPADVLERLEGDGQVLLRYTSPSGERDPAWNLNGADGAIAGLTSAAGNVFGLMPHPERAMEPSLGSSDGRTEPKMTAELAASHGLSPEEWDRVKKVLGRDPTITELGILSVMWSEHCSYKSSRIHLKKLPSAGRYVLQGPGENAGIVDVGDGWAAVFKTESHNHPSFVEPRQGAATGVGGILRDIFTMGARPVASMNSLRFGAIDHPRTRYLIEGVVAGIGGYGNCFGCPTVGGEVQFHPSYDGNILVNAFNLGLVRTDQIFRGVAAGAGNPVIYVGSKTGRDGIHGASLLASAEFDDETDQKRPTVQVGDPFTEKLLLEACLELMKTDAIIGIQDMGAAGLTCSSAEMAGRGGLGIELDLDLVPRREASMTPYELMLSESQERMLIVATAGREAEVEEVFQRWDLDVAVVGRVTDDGHLRVVSDGHVVANLPVTALTDEAPFYDRPAERPAWQDEIQQLDLDSVAIPDDMSDALTTLIESPNHASREWVFHQYDHTIGTNTVVGPGQDAAVVRIKGTEKALAMSLDGNARWVWLDPRAGARLAVAEAIRNVATAGARPIGITDCLNFGNPERPEIMWQFAETVAGIAEACEAFEVPVVSGNVSFYNETDGSGIQPTPTIGAVGLLERPHKLRPGRFRKTGDTVALIGTTGTGLGGSSYLAVVHGLERGLPPALDLDLEMRSHDCVREALVSEFLSSIHDIADGGLALALAECCLGPPAIGAHIRLDQGDLRLDELLFAETPSRFVVSLPSECLDGLAGIADDHDVELSTIGEVGGDELIVEVGGRVVVRVEAAELERRWRTALRRALLKR